MPIRRTYGCDTCGLNWIVDHASGDEPFPPCPACAAKSAWRPQSFRTRSAKTSRIDHEKRLAAEQFGMTDFNDSTRQGDIAAKIPSLAQTTVDREAMLRQTAEATRQIAARMVGTVSPEMQETARVAATAFSGGTPAATSVQQPVQAPKDPGQMMAMAAQASAETRAINGGQSPMQMLHRGLKSGKHDITRQNIIARAPLS